MPLFANLSSWLSVRRGTRAEEENLSPPTTWSLSPEDTRLLKGVAICLMLWHHLFDGARDLGGWTWWWGRHGNICVAMFLFLSGYGMAAVYGSRLAGRGFFGEAVRCWAKRVWSLFLGYWPVFVPSVLAGVFLFHRGLAEAYGVAGGRKWICLAVDFCAFGGYRSYNVTWWFYRVILVCYALFPFCSRLAGSRRWVWAFAPLLLTGAFDWTGTFCREWILSRWLFSFLVGMFAFSLAARWGKCKGRFLNVAVWALGVVAGVSGFWMRDRCWGETMDGFLAPALAIALLPVLRCGGPLKALLGFLGRHSMNVFMVHTFICTYFFPGWIESISRPWMRFSVLLGASLLVSCPLEFLKRLAGWKTWTRNPPFARWLPGGGSKNRIETEGLAG